MDTKVRAEASLHVSVSRVTKTRWCSSLYFSGLKLIIHSEAINCMCQSCQVIVLLIQ